MYATRFLELKILRYLDTKEIIAIIGPRQAGKTTLLKKIFEKLNDAHLIDFEDVETLELFNTDIKSFAELHIKPYRYVCIDEFQYAKEGGKRLKYLYDIHNTKIIISGSSATELSIQSIPYLVGRIFVFHLYPFSFEEYLNFKEPLLYENIYMKQKDLSPEIIRTIGTHFKEFCVFGGYPRVAITSDREEKRTILRNIYNTYFLREIKEILNLPGDHRLTKVFQYLAIHIGNLISYSELVGFSGFSFAEINNYLNTLEKTFITARSIPYYTNKRTELVKSPKIFFLDAGLRNSVLNNFNELDARTDKGSLYENCVASELVKAEKELRYWRTKSKAEVDFILSSSTTLVPLEVKSYLAVAKVSRSFHSFMEKYQSQKGIILSEKLSTEKEKVLFRPIFQVQKLAAEIE